MGVITNFASKFKNNIPSQITVIEDDPKHHLIKLKYNDLDEKIETWLKEFQLRLYYNKQNQVVARLTQFQDRKQRLVSCYKRGSEKESEFTGDDPAPIIKYVSDEFDKVNINNASNLYLKEVAEPLKKLFKVDFSNLCATLTPLSETSGGVQINIDKDKIKITAHYENCGTVEIPLSAKDCDKQIIFSVIKMEMDLCVLHVMKNMREKSGTLLTLWKQVESYTNPKVQKEFRALERFLEDK